MKRRWMGRFAVVAVALGVALAGCSGGGNGLGFGPIVQLMTMVSLSSNKPGAASLDANLENAWGMAFNPATGFAWVTAAETGKAEVFDGAGARQLSVTIPPPPAGAAPGHPTGIVFNDSADFQGDKFIVVTEDGTIAGWQAGANAVIRRDNSAADAIYKGLAIATSGAGRRLYAANFHAGTIDVFDRSYTPVALVNAFVDPQLPADFAPFNIQNLGGRLYVTYAKQDAAKEDEIAGAGLGAVDVFDANGVLLSRLASGGALDAPWGLALAPSGFGKIGGAVLVGNFGDGRINIFNPKNGAFLGQIKDAAGIPLSIEGLWALAFGTTSAGGHSQLYFAAGPNDEADGLFGRLDPA